MLTSNNKALGIIFPNSYDTFIPELVAERAMASIPFASRYRMIDFVLSNMVNCGIDNISVIVRQNYHSLMDHLGAGREWDLTRKNGGLTIFPPYSERGIGSYQGRVDALASILNFLKDQKEKYIILTDANIASKFDYEKMIKAHKKSGADVTIAYNEGEIADRIKKASNPKKEQYYCFKVEGERIVDIEINSKDDGVKNISMNTYVMEREKLIEMITDANERGGHRLERDILIPQIKTLQINGYKYDGYVARITDMLTYFNENMKLLEDDNLDALFDGNTIYTKIRDDNPTRYIAGASAKKSMVADGCVIEGTIENCVLFRGVKVGKGAVVKNCILMQDTVVEEGAQIENLITDKRVTIGAGKSMKGETTYPYYIAKGQTV
ncbi:MAG: glucose-1-phosphate adenylyltransferase subunit GlgD [Clostridiales bacterium]|nr:glucose-1-phosphate adenylyltransferase subunit GlgD [Candidatus Blautia equi]